MKRLIYCLIGILGMLPALYADPPVNFLSASRSLEFSSPSGEFQNSSPDSEFSNLDQAIGVEDFSWSSLWSVAAAAQRSSFRPWQVNAEMKALADQDFSGFGAGYGTSEFELSFEVTAPVGYVFAGDVSGYDGYGSLTLTSVGSISATTIVEDPENPFLTSPGSGSIKRVGSLEPGTYTLRSNVSADPTLGGSGSATSRFSLTFLPATFAEWLESNNLPAEISPLSDDDEDGLSLIEEYAFDSSPSLANSLENEFIFDPESRVITLSYPTKRPDLTYIPEWSSDLKTWSSTGITQTPTSSSFQASAAQPRIALRLRLVLP